MCGLVTLYNRKQNVDPSSLVQLYNNQRLRGVEGFGFSYLTRGGLVKTRRFKTEAECFYAVSRLRTQLIQFHHRTPTSTENVEFQNHPICDSKYHQRTYALTHNGIIWNNDILKKEHYKDGIKYTTKDGKGKYNDSETLLHELARYIEDGKTVNCNGSIAFVLLEIDTETHKLINVHYGRNNQNPLHSWTYGDDVVISSECGYKIEDKKGKEIDTELPALTLHTLHWKNGKVDTDDIKFRAFPSSYSSSVNNGNYGYSGYGYDRYGGYGEKGWDEWEDDGSGFLTPSTKKSSIISKNKNAEEVLRIFEEGESNDPIVKGKAAIDVQNTAKNLYADNKGLTELVEDMLRQEVCNDVEVHRLLSDIDLQISLLVKLNTRRARRMRKGMYRLRVTLLNWADEVPKLGEGSRAILPLEEVEGEVLGLGR